MGTHTRVLKTFKCRTRGAVSYVWVPQLACQVWPLRAPAPQSPWDWRAWRSHARAGCWGAAGPGADPAHTLATSSGSCRSIWVPADPFPPAGASRSPLAPSRPQERPGPCWPLPAQVAPGEKWPCTLSHTPFLPLSYRRCKLWIAGCVGLFFCFVLLWDILRYTLKGENNFRKQSLVLETPGFS